MFFMQMLSCNSRVVHCRSMLFTTACIISYTIQGDATGVQFLLPQIHDSKHTTPRPRSVQFLNGAWPWSVVAASYVIVGIFSTVSALHFIFVVRTVVRLVEPATWGVTNISTEDVEMNPMSHTPDSDSGLTVSDQISFSLAQASIASNDGSTSTSSTVTDDGM